MQDIHPDIVSPDRLVNEILHRPSSSTEDQDKCNEGKGETVILDCQNPSEFMTCHIRGAVNVTFPAIMVRRIAAGKIDLFEKSKELKAKIASSHITFVVYDSHVPNTEDDEGEEEVNEKEEGANNKENKKSNECELSDLVSLVAKKLAQHGCHVATLKGGLFAFKEQYPEWIESNDTKKTTTISPISSESKLESSGEVPLLGLGSLASLRINEDEPECDSCIGLDLDDSFPVEIIPNLYLGNASISSDLAILERHKINHILNVTPDLPNLFEDSIRYFKIPISDHWTQSMLSHFPQAIQFIDEGRSKDEGVLVHCLAGISRSVTIVICYLMYKNGLSLNEAYDMVRKRKANISPNFHFMGQLLDFERQLHSQFLSPIDTLGTSPDSGIEFDRWNSN